MITKTFISLIKIIFILFFSLFSLSSFSKNIIIDGNENIDDDVIFSIIGNNLKDNLDDNDINSIIKKLFDTGNFKKIEVNENENEIIIKIVENPVIKKVNFSGNKRFKKEIIFEQFNKDDFFNNYNTIKINQFINELTKLYNSFGYNLVDINYDVSKNNDDSNYVDLNFIITEGKISKINKIYFVDNQNFDKNDLLSEIKSKPRNIFRFLSSSNFKKYQIQNDVIRISDFYKNNGYKDISIDYKTEFITSTNRFNVYFYLDEGVKYIFNDFSYILSDIALNDYQSSHIQNLLNNFYDKKIKNDKSYNKSYIDDIKVLISEYLFKEGIVFFEILVLEKIIESNIDILFQIKSIEPKYVNQINIKGNSRTNDKVIRREVTFAEGDAINNNLISRSSRNINRLDIFQKVDVNETYIDENTIDVDIEVEEKSTGEFQVGVAFGTLEGATFVSGLKEKNIAGLGREIDLTINTAEKNTKYNFSIREPYILNKKINFIYGISYEEIQFVRSSFDITKFNTKSGFEYNLLDDLSHSITLEYSLKDYSVTDSSKVEKSIANQEGNNADILLNNKLFYDKLNSFIRPSKGTYVSYLNTISPITNDDNGFMKNVITHRKYIKYDKNVISVQTRVGNIVSFQNKEILTDDKFSLGGRWLRGFDAYGAGPRNSRTSYIGGNSLIVSKLDYQRPLFKNSDNPIDLNLFIDAGKIFDNKTTPTNSKESIRSSYGAGIKFYSPIGPVGFSWAFPITSESYDIERMFLFSIGNLN